MVKLCVHCAYCINARSATPYCKSPQSLDVVTGIVEGDSCHRMRENRDKCGMEGRWWAPLPLSIPGETNDKAR